MRFTVQLPTDKVQHADEFLSAAALAEMARTAEAAGFEAAFVTDHPAPPDSWLSTGGHHALDPFVALSFAAAATVRLRLQTHVLIAAYRNPFLVAKAIASLDVLSGGRAILGLAAGYLEEEFRALGADYEARNELADEAIDVIRRVWCEDGVALRGRDFEAAGNTALPRPVQEPGPPIWVGGNSRRAIRRAVEHADGWLPFPAPAAMAGRVGTAALESHEDLQRGLDYAREHGEKVGRTTALDVAFSPLDLSMYSRELPPADSLQESAADLSARGVTWMVISLPARTRDEWCERVQWVGENLIRKAR